MYPIIFFFFFNDTATTEIYTLSLHDALPIFQAGPLEPAEPAGGHLPVGGRGGQVDRRAGRGEDTFQRDHRPGGGQDRKSTRLNSSHLVISYAVFCLKKKKHSAHYQRPMERCC